MQTHSFADLHELLRGTVKQIDRVGSPDSLILHGIAQKLHWLANRVERRLDRLFWHSVQMARLGPDIHFAVSREVREPFRTGRVIVLHLEPFKPGIAIGWLSKPDIDPYDDNAISEHVRRAVSLRKPTQKELDEFDDEVLHGPGKPTGLRFSATRGGAARGGSSGRVDVTRDAWTDL